MNILLLDQFSDPGGAQLNLLDTLGAIRKRGWNALVGMPGSGEMFERVRALGFEAERIRLGPYESGRKSMGDLARFAVDTAPLAGQIRRMARRAGADLVYVNGPRALPATALAGLKIPALFHAHSYLPEGAVRKLARWSLASMSAMVAACCEFVAAPWEGTVERVSVVYNGVAGPAGDGAPARGAGLRIGCIGRIAPEKGQLEFVRAARLIHAQRPDAQFVIYGAPLFSGDEYEREVRAAAAGLPVEFAGWVSDVYRALETIDMLIAPSFAQEATTRVILEAFSAGVPVIAFPSGGIPEVVEHGVNGWLAQNVEEIARAALSVEIGRLGAAAQESWARRFRVERYQDEIAAFMERAAGAE
jgi:glycosyltransferase involved in cell wall biosynthesis